MGERGPVEGIGAEAAYIVQPTAELPVLPAEERVLTEIDNLARARREDGSYPQEALDNTLQNIFTMVQEGGMRYAITKTRHEAVNVIEQGRPKRTFMWLGKTALQVAESGYQFHHHEAAHKRVDIEVQEAVYNDEALRPGYACIFISPRMTEKDAPKAIAKREHLYDDDALRMSVPITNEHGAVVERELHSMLTKLPLDAIYRWLQDPNNDIFKRSFAISDVESALPAMQLHTELEARLEDLPEGLLTIVADITRYISDPKERAEAEEDLAIRREIDQGMLEKQGKAIARRWLEFKKTIVESRVLGRAVPTVEAFIDSLHERWDGEARTLIEAQRQPDGSIAMSRQLEALLAEAYANISVKRGKIASGDESVFEEADAHEIAEIREQERRLQLMEAQGYSWETINQYELSYNDLVAGQNISAGGGCMGESRGRFTRTAKGKMTLAEAEASAGEDEEAAERAEDLVEAEKAKGDGLPPKIRCIMCNKKSKKELVVRETSWRCPCCKYEVDICTGKPIHEAETGAIQRQALLDSIVEITLSRDEAAQEPQAVAA